MDAIRTKGLTRMFGHARAVDDVDLVVPQGAVFGLVGENGAGKSTLLKLVSGLLARDAGEVSVLGRPLASCESDPRVGVLIERPAVYPRLDPFENLMNRALVLGLPEPERACREALAVTGLDERVAGDGRRRLLWARGTPAEELSLGMCQRLGVALALLGSPELLFLDEPLNGVDPATSKAIRELLVRLNRERGVTVVVSSHVIAHLERICTHFGIMRRGRLVHVATADELALARARHLVLEVEEPDRAVAVLAEELPGLRVTVREDRSLAVASPGGGEPDRAVLSRTLMEAGIAVLGLRREDPGLEDELVGLMGGAPDKRNRR